MPRRGSAPGSEATVFFGARDRSPGPATVSGRVYACLYRSRLTRVARCQPINRIRRHRVLTLGRSRLEVESSHLSRYIFYDGKYNYPADVKINFSCILYACSALINYS